MFVGGSVRSSLHLVRFGQLLCCADKRIVNEMKVGIERNKMKVELIRFLDIIDSIDVYFFEARNSMQYRSPNATQDSCSQQCILSPLGGSI